MKYNPLIIVCIISCIFFQIIPISAILLNSEIQSKIRFVENPYYYFFLLISAIIITILSFICTKKRVKDDTNIFEPFNKYQKYFWFIGNSIAYVLFLPALITSVLVYIRVMNIGYGDVEPTTPIESIILYAHLMGISFLFVGYTDSISRLKVALPFFLIIFPRFLISASGPRVFVFQALVPCFFFLYPILKNFIRKHFISVVAAGLFLSILPYIVGNRVGGELNWVTIYVFGSPILYLIHSPLKSFNQMHLVFAGLVYSFFGSDVFGYKRLFDLGGYKIRFDWIFTRLTIGPDGEHHMGTGGNPIFEAYTEGVLGFIILFALLGIICNFFDFRKQSMLNRFVFPHIIAKIGFFWRGTFVELIDRTVYYILIYMFSYVIFIVIKNRNLLFETRK